MTPRAGLLTRAVAKVFRPLQVSTCAAHARAARINRRKPVNRRRRRAALAPHQRRCAARVAAGLACFSAGVPTARHQAKVPAFVRAFEYCQYVTTSVQFLQLTVQCAIAQLYATPAPAPRTLGALCCYYTKYLHPWVHRVHCWAGVGTVGRRRRLAPTASSRAELEAGPNPSRIAAWESPRYRCTASHTTMGCCYNVMGKYSSEPPE